MAMHARASTSTSRAVVKMGRAVSVALGLVLVGSTTYAALSWNSGEIKHWSLGEGTRLTSVGFDSWSGIVPAPDYPECSYREVQLPSGQWVKHGHFSLRTREASALVDGSYHEGRRTGRWTFWNREGSIDVERSGFYSEDVRVEPGPTSNTDIGWYLDARDG